MEVAEFGKLTDEDRRALGGDELDPFDAAGIELRYPQKDSHVGLEDESCRLVASTGMVVVDVEVERQRFAVVGFGGVIISAPYRGRGLARRVLEEALGRARQLGPEFAMLFCHEDRTGLYRKLGFVDVIADVWVEQPSGHAPMPQRTMWRSLHDRAVWPEGVVTMHSLPF